MATFKVKRIGNHWYPCINHDLGYINGFNEKISRFLNRIDVYHNEELTFDLEETVILFEGENIIDFNESDIVTYITTDDDFDVRFTINDREFTIHSDLYSLLENQFQFDFHKTNYIISIY